MFVNIENQNFEGNDFNLGLKVLKMKYRDLSKMPSHLYEKIDFWDSIELPTADEILGINNAEKRRLVLKYITSEELAQVIPSEVVDKETIEKTTVFYDENLGIQREHTFQDTYKLHLVHRNVFDKYFNASMDHLYYVSFKDTSTDRKYILWVDANQVANINNGELNAINAIAWTIRVSTPPDNIEKIIRQGDLILVKVYKNVKCIVRHLTGKEYREKLALES